MSATPDTASNNWVDRFAPRLAKPYLRLMRADRPIGTWLLLLPCWFGLALAATDGSSAPFLYYAFLFIIGAFVMRGSGCAYNDIVDRDFDAQVERTALRPIPSGQITMRQAWVFLVALSLTGLIVLLQFNQLTILLGFASLGLVAAYPFMKRVTWWPQAWLGLTFNWGVPVGFAAAAGKLNITTLLLYAACILWTLGYDTIYAHQDKEDDALIGVKSSARRLGDNTKPALTAFYSGVIFLFALIGITSQFGIAYFFALVLPALHFAWQIKSLNINDGVRCLALFKSNRDAGFLLLAPLLLETFL